FKLEAVIQTKNPILTERILHEELASSRINQRREFFKISIKEATAAAYRAAKQSKARVRRRESASKKAKAFDQLLSSMASSVWIATFSPALALPVFIVCLWGIATRTPLILWETLAIPSILGRFSVPVMTGLAIFPIATGKIEFAQLLQTFTDLRQMVSI